MDSSKFHTQLRSIILFVIILLNKDEIVLSFNVNNSVSIVNNYIHSCKPFCSSNKDEKVQSGSQDAVTSNEDSKSNKEKEALILKNQTHKES